MPCIVDQLNTYGANLKLSKNIHFSNMFGQVPEHMRKETERPQIWWAILTAHEMKEL